MSLQKFILMIAISVAACDITADFTIKPIQNTPGLYFEKLGHLQTLHTEWSLLVYLDVIPVCKEYRSIQKQISSLTKGCASLRNNSLTCETLAKSSRASFDAITNQARLIEDLLNLDNKLKRKNKKPRRKNKKRNKRALFGFVGSVSKALFGTLDEGDAKRYNNDIKKLRLNQDHLHTLIKRQQSILEAQVGYLTNLTTFTKNLRADFENRMKFIADSLASIQDRISSNTLDIRVTNAFQIFTNALQNYKMAQDGLLKILEAATHGQVDLLLLSRKDLHEELDKISRNLKGGDVKLPFPENENMLYEMIRCKRIYPYGGKLNFLLSIPLVAEWRYELHKMSIVPRFINNSYMTFIMPKQDHIALHVDSRTYFTLSHLELERCTADQISKSYVCETTKPVSRSLDSDCESQILLQLTQQQFGAAAIRRRCTARITRSEHQMFVTLVNPFAWIYAFPFRKTVSITCDGQSRHTEQLYGTGVITLAPGCKLISDHVTIAAKRITKSSLDTKPMHQISFVEIPEELLRFDVLSKSKDVPSLSTDLQYLNSALDTDALKKMSTDLAILGEDVKVQPLLDLETTASLSTTWIVVIVLVVLALVIFGSGIAYKTLRRFKWNYKPPRNDAPIALTKTTRPRSSVNEPESNDDQHNSNVNPE